MEHHGADLLEDTDLTYNLQCGKWMEVAYEYHDDAFLRGNINCNCFILAKVIWLLFSVPWPTFCHATMTSCTRNGTGSAELMTSLGAWFELPEANKIPLIPVALMTHA